VHELQLEETPLHPRLDPIPPLSLTTPKPLLPTPPSPRPTSILSLTNIAKTCEFLWLCSRKHFALHSFYIDLENETNTIMKMTKHQSTNYQNQRDDEDNKTLAKDLPTFGTQ
jgi:hypothetical protein